MFEKIMCANFATKISGNDEYIRVQDPDYETCNYLILNCLGRNAMKNPLATVRIKSFIKRRVKVLTFDEMKNLVDNRAKNSWVTFDMLLSAMGYIKMSDVRNVVKYLTPEIGDWVDLRYIECHNKWLLENSDKTQESYLESLQRIKNIIVQEDQIFETIDLNDPFMGKILIKYDRILHEKEKISIKNMQCILERRPIDSVSLAEAEEKLAAIRNMIRRLL